METTQRASSREHLPGTEGTEPKTAFPRVTKIGMKCNLTKSAFSIMFLTLLLPHNTPAFSRTISSVTEQDKEFSWCHPLLAFPGTSRSRQAARPHRPRATVISATCIAPIFKADFSLETEQNSLCRTTTEPKEQLWASRDLENRFSLGIFKARIVLY